MAVASESLDFTFLNAVNRVLRTNTLIRGDDDDVTTFSDVQHSANLNIARIAIQDELTEITAERLIDLELAEGTLTTSAGARVYDVASNFIRFAGTAFLYKADANRQIYEYPGGRDGLRSTIFDYKSQSGEPNWWYWEPSSKKRIGLYQVPDKAYTYTYDYERSVYVTVEADEIPMHNQEEADTFCQMAARRFKFLYERVENLPAALQQDPMYTNAKSRLYNLMHPKQPRRAYGRSYR